MGGWLADLFGYSSIFWASAAAGGVMALLAGFLKQQAGRDSTASYSVSETISSIKQLLSIRPMQVALLYGFVLLLASGVRDWFAPLYMKEVANFSTVTVGTVLTIGSVASMAVRLSAHWVRRLFGNERVMFVSMVMSAAGIVLLPLFRSVPSVLLVIVAVYAAVGFVHVLSYVTVSENASPERQGLAASLESGVFHLALTAGPLFFAFVLQAGGFTRAFTVSGALLCVMVGVTSALMFAGQKNSLRRKKEEKRVETFGKT
jgi:predicted MFS family arabinose efflux permease